ncbi:P-loop NTPase family protein [[Kitasatospora] papulosa]|uniref:ParA family protein n=1 Tax=[Kitasatospora] papulosa TaxID=1464011 RepID=UPI00363C3F79
MTGSVTGWRLEVPIDNGDREPELSSAADPAALFTTNRRGCADLGPRSRVRGKTSTSSALAQLWAQRGDNRILITDIDSQQSAGALDDLPQAYTPLIIDCPPSSGYPAGGPLWEEALRALGPDSGDAPTP